jgi:hypothetical protein
MPTHRFASPEMAIFASTDGKISSKCATFGGIYPGETWNATECGTNDSAAVDSNRHRPDIDNDIVPHRAGVPVSLESTALGLGSRAQLQ